MPRRGCDSGVTPQIVPALSHHRDDRHHESEYDDEEDEEQTDLPSPYLAFDGRQFLRRVGWSGDAQIELASARGRDRQAAQPRPGSPMRKRPRLALGPGLAKDRPWESLVRRRRHRILAVGGVHLLLCRMDGPGVIVRRLAAASRKQEGDRRHH